MVTQLLLSLVLGFARWLLSIIPNFGLPTGMSSPPALFVNTIANAGKLNNILPLDVMVACSLFLYVVFMFALILRLSRVLLSLFTGGGGGAG